MVLLILRNHFVKETVPLFLTLARVLAVGISFVDHGQDAGALATICLTASVAAVLICEQHICHAMRRAFLYTATRRH